MSVLRGADQQRSFLVSEGASCILLQKNVWGWIFTTFAENAGCSHCLLLKVQLKHYSKPLLPRGSDREMFVIRRLLLDLFGS
ncbi:hypothetical protein PAHAL_4G113500 [Panicum hallii]|uniref:Uncharacterized protein n=1 Tax=Panicum hallii TaxID=206008 RepID=A0A2S3HJ62_9POAL|nr:hypothetical protein PAHAL_4G113500 [Panicum hallii]